MAEKITISTVVYDEFGSPLKSANISIDNKAIASTNNNGTVTIPNIATMFSLVKISYVGMKDYVVSAVFLPKAVHMVQLTTELPEITIVVPKNIKMMTTDGQKINTETQNKSTVTEPKKVNWLLLIAFAGLGFRAYEHFYPKTVKAKI